MRDVALSLSLAAVMWSIPLVAYPQTYEEQTTKDVTTWGMVSEGFQLAVQTEKQTFDPEEPVWLIVYLRNTSNKSASAFSSVQWVDYIVEVKTRKGQRVSPTEEARMLAQKQKDDMPMSSREVRLFPGQMVTDRLLLNKLCNINNPGTYSVVVKRKIPKRDDKHWTQVSASAITITIAH